MGSFSLITAAVAIALSSQVNAQPVERDVSSSNRGGCARHDDCFRCISGGCAWSQPFLIPVNVFRTVEAEILPTCTDNCYQVGTDSSCYLSDNFGGADPGAICAMASDAGTHTEPIEAEEEHILTRVPTLSPTNIASLRTQSPTSSPSVLIPVVHAYVPLPVAPPPASSPSNNIPVVYAHYPLPEEDDFPIQFAERETANPTTGHPESIATATPSSSFLATSSTTGNLTQQGQKNTTNATYSEEPPKISCTGFIVCEDCPAMQCIFAAWTCSAICPELAHVPCWEINGNYTNMTKADVCVPSEREVRKGEEPEQQADKAESLQRIEQAAVESSSMVANAPYQITLALVAICIII